MTLNAHRELASEVAALFRPESVRRPATPGEFARFEKLRGMRLPDEVVAFYSTCDGTDEPTDPQHGWVQIWPLADWKPVSDVLDSRLSSPSEPLVFADHCLSSWWYALDFQNAFEGRTPVLLVDGVRTPFQVFDSFEHFMRAILADSQALYGQSAAQQGAAADESAR